VLHPPLEYRKFKLVIQLYPIRDAMGLTVGVAKGVSMIVMRELVGVFELLTSPAPWPNSDFSPVLEPEYPWHYFRD
jgi:putative exosortase-associated protein (TIGR04073 family)